MKKTMLLILIAVLLVLAVLFVPNEVRHYEDGGSVEYIAIAAKYVHFHFDDVETGSVTPITENRVYFYPENEISFDELKNEVWEQIAWDEFIK